MEIQIAKVAHLWQNARVGSTPCAILAIDMAKAFDSVPINKLLLKLQDVAITRAGHLGHNMEIKLINVIHKLIN